MSTAIPELNCDSAQTLSHAWQAGRTASWWSQRREASLNWLALGVLLAAWNASENGMPPPAARRPEALRRYVPVSVRAATLHAAALRDLPAGP